MSELAQQFQGLLDTGLISRIRRNHGLEHATLHVLAERHPGQPVAGHSDQRVFGLLEIFLPRRSARRLGMRSIVCNPENSSSPFTRTAGRISPLLAFWPGWRLVWRCMVLESALETT